MSRDRKGRAFRWSTARGCLDAWVELSELIADPTFGEFVRANALEVSQSGVSLSGLEKLNLEIGAAATSARAQGLDPASDGMRELVERYIAGLAALAGRSADDSEFRRALRARFDRQDPRATRYWQLGCILNPQLPMAQHMSAWGALIDAVKQHLRGDA